jgi:hypothetical protein
MPIDGAASGADRVGAAKRPNPVAPAVSRRRLRFEIIHPAPGIHVALGIPIVFGGGMPRIM